MGPSFFERHGGGERRTERIAEELPAAIYGDRLGGPIHGAARDLSDTGLCFATRSDFPPAAASRISLPARDGALSVRVRATWQHFESGEKRLLTGFEFVRPSRSERRAIAALASAAASRIARALERTRLPELGIGDLTPIARAARLRACRAGHLIYGSAAHRHHAQSLFVVLEGEVSLHLAGGGRRRVAAGLAAPGDLFGTLDPPGPDSIQEVAVAERDAQLLEIHAEAFEGLRRDRPQLAVDLALAALRAARARHRSALLATSGEADREPGSRSAAGPTRLLRSLPTPSDPR